MVYKTKGAALAAERCKSRAIKFDDRLLLKENGCIEWQGSKDKDGYGTLRLDKRDWKAHRYSYYRVYGEIPKNTFICHKCDNPSCVNIEHLFAGTARDNSKDMIQKDRHAKGEKNGYSKLNDHMVKVIRRRLQEGESQTAIAKDMGVWQTVISSIKLGKTWTHVK